MSRTDGRERKAGPPFTTYIQYQRHPPIYLRVYVQCVQDSTYLPTSTIKYERITERKKEGHDVLVLLYMFLLHSEGRTEKVNKKKQQKTTFQDDEERKEESWRRKHKYIELSSTCAVRDGYRKDQHRKDTGRSFGTRDG